MRAKLDENMPLDAGQLLAAAGWSVATVHDEGLSGAPDHLVITACQTEGRVLFSLDLDFADIRFYPPDKHNGIVVLRPVEPDRDSVLALLTAALPLLSAEPVRQRLWIVEPDRIRIRGGSEETS
jgi:predicted nuclease of predicted toxin-antitoxin system